MNLYLSLRQLVTAGREQLTNVALSRVEEMYPEVEKMLRASALGGKRIAEIQIQPQENVNDMLLLYVAAALKARLECDGLDCTVLKPTGPEFPGLAPVRKHFAVEVRW